MKKITVLILSLLLLFNSCGYIFAYFQLDNIFKQEAEARIIHGCPPQEISIIEDSPKVEKLDQGEIRLDGMKYDIIKTETKNGRLIYYCMSDEQESNLDKTLINQVEDNTSSSSTAPVKNILRGLFSDILITTEKSFQGRFRLNKYLIPEPDLYRNNYSRIIIVPPRFS